MGGTITEGILRGGVDRTELPQDVEAERAFLEALFMEPDRISYCINIVRVEDFYRETNRLIFQSAIHLFQKDIPINVVNIKDELSKMKVFPGKVQLDYLMTLFEGTGLPSHLDSYAEIIKQKALRRALIRASDEISRRAYDQGVNIRDLVDETEQKVFSITQEKTEGGLVALSEVVDETVDPIIKRMQEGSAITGVPTGIDLLDKLTGGYQRSDLIILAARPGMGKTSLALNIAMRAAGLLPRNVKNREKEKRRYSVAIFSLEMPVEQLVMRMLARVCEINLAQLRTAQVSRELAAMLAIRKNHLKDAPIYIDDSPRLNIIEMKAKLRRLIQETRDQIDLVMLDYLQLMAPVRQYQSKVQEVAEISGGLKQIAREFQIPVMALSQLSRAPEKRSSKDMTPQLSDLRDSGSIEQDADIVQFIYRPEVYFPEEPEYQGKAKLIVAKHRNGPTGDMELGFIREWASFENLAQGE